MGDNNENERLVSERANQNTFGKDVGDASGNNGSLKKVSDWVRRSVLFWNKQDTLSIDESSDAQENDGESEQIEELTKNKDSELDHNKHVNQTELDHNKLPVKEKDLPESSSTTGDLFLDVEKIQRLCIDPFIMETDFQEVVTGDNRSNDSPYYTLNFPKYTRHMYSPLYEENPTTTKGILCKSVNDKNDWNIADTLNKLNQTWGQVDSKVDNKFIVQKETDVSVNNYDSNNEKMESKQRNYNVDVLNSIKRVQETLGEIAAELENTRTRKTSRDRDPNLILINLLSRIEPPVNRDSFTGSLVEETNQFASQETTETPKSINRSAEVSATPLVKMASGCSSQTEGD